MMADRLSKSILRLSAAVSVGVVGLFLALPNNAETVRSSETTTVAQAGQQTLAEIAGSNENFTILVKLMNHLGVVGALNDPSGEPYTVFAPTDAAFEALPDGTIDALLEPESREYLFDILSYHVIPGAVTSDQLSSGKYEATNGLDLKIKSKSSGVRVNEANVIQADVVANNGVIHVVDSVLLPQR